MGESGSMDSHALPPYTRLGIVSFKSRRIRKINTNMKAHAPLRLPKRDKRGINV